MTPERWARIDRVWQAVLARPERDRASAVLELSAGDDTLRRDVESLLAHLARASAAGFGDTPLSVPAPRAQLIGRQLGPYAVQALLGVGGMGDVYRAHDASLGRDVAVKMLPAHWLADPERRARFDREARLLASLNHPNIGAIYGVHESGAGGRALVLELVEGETLAERLTRPAGSASGRRGLPVDDVVTIASQLTAALEAAHARGIVHRDLKPANIKVTPDGRVKVLDFGLARAVTRADGEPDTPHAEVTNLTEARLLLGTAAYMSPEQARGRLVDKRTDIWAFGCVLYEMLTGAQAFGGADIAETLANVIRAEPAWSALPGDTPPALRVCLRGCLQKDLHQRIHDIGDVRLAMEGAFLATDADRPYRRHGNALGLAGAYAGWAAAALVAAGALAVVSRDRTPVETPDTSPPNPPVIATPRAGGGGGSVTARTIQEAIDLVAPGGTVQVLPGTYAEAITITKTLTLEATGVRSGTVVIAPPGAPEAAIDIATTEPVILRDLTVHVPGAGGIRGLGGVNLTVERTTVRAVNPPRGSSSLIAVSNDSTVTGLRARVVIRASSLDGTVVELERGAARPHSIAVDLEGDVDGRVEHNMIRRMGGVCLRVMTRADLGGETNVDIVNNDIDECHPVARVSAIIVGSPPIERLSPDRPVTASGTVNIIANTIRNTPGDCLTAAIGYDVFSGRIERNRIVDFVQPCATRTPRTIPAAIWIGLRVTGIQMPQVVPTVRFNDIHGNARAGLRIAPSQTIPVDATCNYWGSGRGPSGMGTGDGDAILAEPGAASPLFVPFATSPVAQTPSPRC
jgi:hypothetical protein